MGYSHIRDAPTALSDESFDPSQNSTDAEWALGPRLDGVSECPSPFPPNYECVDSSRVAHTWPIRAQ